MKISNIKTGIIASTAIGAAAATMVWTQLAVAQSPAPKAALPAAIPASASAPVAASVPVPDNAKLTLMIQLHVAALSLANLTGNYTVLHSLGTPAFQTANPVAKLAENFSGFRNQGVDISPALLFAPILVGPPKMEPDNVVRVTGFYATAPQRIAFDLAFQPASGAWRLADIKVRTVIAEPAPKVAQAAPIETGSLPAAETKAKAPKSAAKK